MSDKKTYYLEYKVNGVSKSRAIKSSFTPYIYKVRGSMVRLTDKNGHNARQVRLEKNASLPIKLRSYGSSKAYQTQKY